MNTADDLRFLAIALAALAAVALSFGAQFQNDAVARRKAGVPRKKRRGSLTLKQLMYLMVHPRWVSGLGFLILGIVLQLAALTMAPLIVVQPVGAIALVITSVLNAKINKVRLNRSTILAIAMSMLGIGAFVGLATGVADEVVLTDDSLRSVLAVLGLILVVFGVAFRFLGSRTKALTYIIGAGVLYGFVATLAKVVIQRIYQQQFELLTILCLVGLIVAVFLGGWFVQNAYSSGPPDLVIAGLTVIDPMVAVAVGIIILGEAQNADLLSMIGFGAAGIVAIVGVYLLSKFHPELQHPPLKPSMASADEGKQESKPESK